MLRIRFFEQNVKGLFLTDESLLIDYRIAKTEAFIVYMQSQLFFVVSTLYIRIYVLKLYIRIYALTRYIRIYILTLYIRIEATDVETSSALHFKMTMPDSQRYSLTFIGSISWTTLSLL